jgi:hypothetical protein
MSVLKNLFASVIEAQQQGTRRVYVEEGKKHMFLCWFSNVFLSEQAGQANMEHFMPYITLVVNDNPEGQRLTGIYGSILAESACRMCTYDNRI